MVFVNVAKQSKTASRDSQNNERKTRAISKIHGNTFSNHIGVYFCTVVISLSILTISAGESVRRTEPLAMDKVEDSKWLQAEEAEAFRQKRAEKFSLRRNRYRSLNSAAMLRSKCPESCFCVFDGLQPDRHVVSCRWKTSKLSGNELATLAHFQINIKTLSITCDPKNGGVNFPIGSEIDEPQQNVADNNANEWGNGVRAEMLISSADKQQKEPPLFSGFSELNDLKITGCKISEAIDSELLRGLDKLRSLQLKSLMEVERITVDAFSAFAQLEKLVLVDLNLKQLPHGALCPLSSLRVLNVSSNQLAEANVGFTDTRQQEKSETEQQQQHTFLSTNCSKLQQLLILDLSANRIRQISAANLKPFPALLELRLASNGLSRLSEQSADVEENVFNTTPLLRFLDLSDNQLTDIGHLPETIVRINLARNQLSTLPTSVANLPSLSTLNLSGNRLQQQPNDTGSKAITPATSISLKTTSLDTLDLSGNQFRSLPLSMFGASLSEIRTLNMADNEIASLDSAPGQDLNATKLHELNLSGNQLSELHAGVFDATRELAILRLDNNQLEHIDVQLFAGNERRLHTLSLAGNLLSGLPEALAQLARLRRLDLSRNKISSIQTPLLGKLQHLTHLDLSENLLTKLDGFALAGCANLIELSLARNRLDQLGVDTFSESNRLKRLDLSGNLLRAPMGPVLVHLDSLERVDVSENALTTLHWKEFPTNLDELIANGNSIKQIVGPVETERTTRLLELQSNSLQMLNVNELPTSLEELNLRNNSLTNFIMPTTVGSARLQLNQLDLRDNHFVSIQYELFEQIVVNNAPFGHILIAGNPLVCTCKMDWLVNSNANNDDRASMIAAGTDFDHAECKQAPTGAKRPILALKADEFLCRYESVCEPGCSPYCCSMKLCDCKPECPRDCQCYHDRLFRKNLVYCTGATFNQSASTIPPQQRSVSSVEHRRFNVRSIPLHATHILLSGLEIPMLRSQDFAARARLLELHLNNSGLESIAARTFYALPNLHSIYLTDNNISELNGNEAVNTSGVRLLDLSGNRFGTLPSKLAQTFPQLETLSLARNTFTELPLAYLNGAEVRQHLKHITLGDNPFKCECPPQARENDSGGTDENLVVVVGGRYATQSWVLENLHRIVDAGEILCVENLTQAVKENSTNTLSMQLPNRENDLFVIGMLELLDRNNGICFVQPEGIFGSQQLLALFILALLVAFTLIIVLFIHGCRRSAAVGKKRIAGGGALSAQEYGQSAASAPLSPGCVAKNMAQTFEMPFLCVSSSKFTDCLYGNSSSGPSNASTASSCSAGGTVERRSTAGNVHDEKQPLLLSASPPVNGVAPPLQPLSLHAGFNPQHHFQWPLTSSTPSPIQFTGSGQLVRLNFGCENNINLLPTPSFSGASTLERGRQQPMPFQTVAPLLPPNNGTGYIFYGNGNCDPHCQLQANSRPPMLTTTGEFVGANYLHSSVCQPTPPSTNTGMPRSGDTTMTPIDENYYSEID